MPIHDDLAIFLKYSEHFSAFCKVSWSWKNPDVDGTVCPASCRTSGCRSSSSSGHDAGRCGERRKGSGIVVCLSFQVSVMRAERTRGDCGEMDLSASSACNHLNTPGTHRTVSFALRARQEEACLLSSRGSEGSPQDKPRPPLRRKARGRKNEACCIIELPICRIPPSTRFDLANVSSTAAPCRSASPVQVTVVKVGHGECSCSASLSHGHRSHKPLVDLRSDYRIRSIEDHTCAVAIAPPHTLPHGDDRAFSTRNRQALRWPEISNVVADIHTDLLKTAPLWICDSTDFCSQPILMEKSTRICTALLLLPSLQ